MTRKQNSHNNSSKTKMESCLPPDTLRCLLPHCGRMVDISGLFLSQEGRAGASMEGCTHRDTQEEAKGEKPIEPVKKMIDKNTEVETSLLLLA